MGSLLLSWFRCHLLRETSSDRHATPQSKAAPPLTLYCISLLKTPITFWNHLHFSMDVHVKCTGCELPGGLDSAEVVPTLSPAFTAKGCLSRATLLNEWWPKLPCLSTACQLPFSRGLIMSANKKGPDSCCYTLGAWPLISVSVLSTCCFPASSLHGTFSFSHLHPDTFSHSSPPYNWEIIHLSKIHPFKAYHSMIIVNL